jgi:hypothetical protein
LLSAVPVRAAFTTFETGEVRPLVSPDGNTPIRRQPPTAARIFAVTGSGLSHTA